MYEPPLILPTKEAKTKQTSRNYLNHKWNHEKCYDYAQSGPGSTGYEEVLHIPQNSSNARDILLMMPPVHKRRIKKK